MSKDNVISVDFTKPKQLQGYTLSDLNYDLTSCNISFEGLDNLDGVVTVPVPNYTDFNWADNTTLTNTGSITVTFSEDENK